MVEGISTPTKRSDRLVLEANLDYWDPHRFPRLHRIIFDNTLDQQDAEELVKTREGAVDVLTGLRPLDTLRVAQSPFAKVVKMRGPLMSVFGMFNMRKSGSPWRDVRVRQAVNYAINRPDFIRYATKGNGVIIPALISPRGFGYDPTLAPYPFDPAKARSLLREAGYPQGLAISLIAPTTWKVQAIVVSKMLEQVGFQVTRQILDAAAFNRQTRLSLLKQPPETQTWDIAILSRSDLPNFPVYYLYHLYAVDGYLDWVIEEPELRRLYEQAIHTVDRERQQVLIRQMERHTRDHAYFLFLYSPVQLYAVNKAVAFVPYVNQVLDFDATSVTDQHWSVRKQRAAVPR